MSAIKFRVGAALDANIGSVFVPLEKAAEKARAKIQTTLGSALSPAPYRQASRRIEDAFDQTGRGAKRAARITGQSVDDIKKQFGAYAKAARKDLDLSHVAAAAESELRRIERQAARTRLAFGGGARGAFGGGGAIGIGRRAGIRVSRGAAAFYGYGGALLSTLANGVGVNTDVGSMIQAGVDQQALAQKIINSAPEFNKASTKERESAATDLLSGIQGVANATATDTGEALEGLEAFVAKTGDLKTGQDVMGDLAKLSRATGTNLADMANAAAEVSNNLGDVPDKGKAIDAVMRSIAGQGKMGAVEIKDLASQMAKIATQAGVFEGDKDKNIAMLGAMAQEAKLRGGAASAQQATTSVMSMVSALRNNATVKNWAKAQVRNKKTGLMEGLNPYTDASHSILRSPEELVLEALNYSKGDQLKLGKLFPSKQAFRAIAGYQQVYMQAGGGDKGLEAVHKEFKKFSDSAMTADDVTNAFAAQMDTTKSKVQVLNNEFAQTAQKLAEELEPAIVDTLLPAVLTLAQSLGPAIEGLTALIVGDEFVRGKKQEGLDKTTEGIISDAGNLLLKTHQKFDPLIKQSLPLDKLTPTQLARLRAEDAAHPGARAAMVAKIREEQADAAMKAGKPVLDEYDRKEQAASGQIKTIEQQENADLAAMGWKKTASQLTDSDWNWIQKEAQGGNTQAQDLLRDKGDIEQLKGVLKDLADEKDALVRTLTSGQVVVQLAPGGNTPPPPPAPGAPADSKPE